jgi:hypothetical protein
MCNCMPLRNSTSNSSSTTSSQLHPNRNEGSCHGRDGVDICFIIRRRAHVTARAGQDPVEGAMIRPTAGVSFPDALRPVTS